MDEACGTQWRQDEMHRGFWYEDLSKQNVWKNLEVNGV